VDSLAENRSKMALCDVGKLIHSDGSELPERSELSITEFEPCTLS